MLGWAVLGLFSVVAIRRIEKVRKRPEQVVPGGTLISRYMVQRTPTHFHRGVDIGAPRGTPVRALNSGWIADVYPDCERSGYGNAILLQHIDGTYSFYAHLAGFAVAPGDYVRQGQTIGAVGDTECGSGSSKKMWPHLHLEVHQQMVVTERGRPIIVEDTPPRLDPLWYMRQVGMGP